MYAIENQCTLADFLHDHDSHLARLKETKTPEILTVDGKAEAVLLDAETYQEIMDHLYERNTIAAIREGLAEAERGELMPVEQFSVEVKSRFGIQS